jgi:multiple sugar transport system permease protein
VEEEGREAPVKKSTRQWLVALPFLAPNIIGFLVFTLLPVAAGLLLSMFNWDIFHAPQFVGHENFVELLGFHQSNGELAANDPQFWQYLGNTFFLMLNIPVGMAGSLLVAIVLNQKIRGRSFFRAVFYLPTICGGIATMVLWMWLYNPDFGLLNWLLGMVGIQGPNWLGNYHWAKPSLMIMGLWASIGGTGMILYLAGLQGIPPALYEAAEIDGAGAVKKFLHITWPALTPTTFFIFITGIIGGFQGGFQAAFVMTQGGPAGATSTISFYIFKQAFEWFNVGYAAAIAVVLFLLVLVVTLINWRFSGKKVHYV